VFMAAGRVVADGPVDELMRVKELNALYFGAVA
jgi:hypothetical protein